MLVRLVACSIALLLLASCSQVKENLKPVALEPLDASAESVKFRKVWIHQVTGGQDARYERLQPTVAADVIYAADVDGEVFAVDVDSGKTLWSVDTGKEIGGGVGYANGALYIGTLSGEVMALEASDGALRWQTSISSEIVSTPAADEDTVIAKAIDGRVFALDREDGEILWSYDHTVPVLTLRAEGSPVLAEQVAYVPFDNGQLLAFNRSSGQLRWSTRVGQPKGKTEIERLVDVDSTPLLDGPFVYVAGYQSRLLAVTRGTGRINWAQDVSTFHQIAKAGDKIILVDVDSHIKAFDAITGSLAWENAKLHRRELSPPAVLENQIVVSDYEGYLHAIDLETGEFTGRLKTQIGKVPAQPQTIDDKILFLDQKGSMRMYTFTEASMEESQERASKRLQGALRK